MNNVLDELECGLCGEEVSYRITKVHRSNALMVKIRCGSCDKEIEVVKTIPSDCDILEFIQEISGSAAREWDESLIKPRSPASYVIVKVYETEGESPCVICAHSDFPVCSIHCKNCNAHDFKEGYGWTEFKLRDDIAEVCAIKDAHVIPER